MTNLRKVSLLDLNTITTLDVPTARSDLTEWRAGDAWLGGGTWLFSEPQPHLRRLIDLSAMTWTPLVVGDGGLEVAATCTIAELAAAELPQAWTAGRLIDQCARALWASFKIWNAATVGGNICLALPAGAMTSLMTALDGVGTIWTPDGGERQMPIIDLVTGPNMNALRPGEILRSIHVPSEALTRQSAFRQISLTRHGRSGALLIGTCPSVGRGFTLTLTASTPRPLRLAFPDIPGAAELATAIDHAVPEWFNDMHGRPDWRRHVTLLLAEEVRNELAIGSAR